MPFPIIHQQRFLRLARVVATDTPHHITHRENIFFSDADRETHLTFLQLCAQKAHLEIWAHCLMDNHVHLIAVPRRNDSLARGNRWQASAVCRMLSQDLCHQSWRGGADSDGSFPDGTNGRVRHPLPKQGHLGCMGHAAA